MITHQLTAEPLVVGRKRSRKRRITLDRAMRQANKADVAVSSATLNADGSVMLEFGGNGQDHRQQQNDDWDTL
jgi:hypothetical protein